MAQPDDREHRQGGDEEACMAVLNDFYGDGLYFIVLFRYIDCIDNCIVLTVRPVKAQSPIAPKRKMENDNFILLTD